jgi:hypothetical protein
MMNTILRPLSIIAAAILITACGPKKDDEPVPPGKMRVDLSKYGKPFTMVIPDSSKGPFTITEQNFQLEVKSGAAFGLVVEEGEGNMEQLKNDIKSDDVKKFKRYLTEDPAMIVWESEITQPEYHIYAVVTAGNSKYVIHDLENTESEPYNEEQIKIMVDAVKSVKVLSEEDLKEKAEARKEGAK